MTKPSWRTIGLVAVGTVLAAVLATAVGNAGSGGLRVDRADLIAPQRDTRKAPVPRGKEMPRGPFGDFFRDGKSIEQKLPDGRTIRVERGTLKTIDAGNMTIDQDAKDVTFPVTDQTRLARDGEPVTLADLKAGEQITAMREKTGDGEFVTRAVMAGKGDFVRPFFGGRRSSGGPGPDEGASGESSDIALPRLKV